ncbi:rhodanese-like domain-containing protein [Pandoraea pulmonicola]|uniref:Molybdopterin biosynthesis protein MoeB n=1 Tax=Pandoraea pulmonicola TaxID=93221 RepID=A0AAJ4ZCX1_PANPU|nr:rhodanese-like domain-containing protein [Pandoraea pulmonicola]AJC23175.2 sulfurtransferase [Pandoraea pulmonicola]SUA91017.1 molybdopterin biosynthesis protein MoeB [Pandoraea pulmonicola]
MTSFIPQFVPPSQLKAWLHDGDEIAVFDVREHGQYGEAHLFYGVTLPYSRLEIDIVRLAPRRDARIVVYDTDASVAVLAAQRLAALGYSDVHVLEGGTNAWQQAGYTLFAGVNVPSKTFGELVEMAYHTPRVTARELAAMRERGENVVILDGRPVSEYLKMTIPSSICCPNGELGYRIRELVPDTTTPIVVNCAGRTRSIIGAQTLINLGIPNPVMALENGTQGWYLEDLPLEHGSTRRYPDAVASSSLAQMREASQALAARFAVPEVDAATFAQWAEDTSRTLFLCDVRTPEEFAAGSLPGAQHTPGGQLIQATDQYVGVRHARVVLFDSDGVRAPIVASWLRQLGHDAYVLRDGLASGASLRASTPGVETTLPRVDAAALASALADGSVLAVDLRPSMSYRREHVPGSQWAIRPRLPQLPASRNIVLVADEPGVAELFVADWRAKHRQDTRTFSLLSGGLKAWVAAGHPVESTPDLPPDADCIDYLFFVHDRHDGNKAAARQYLAWETGLLAQLDDQERGAFRIGEPAAK